MTLNPCKGERKLWVREFLDRLVIKQEFRSAAFPDAPRARCFDPDLLVVARQTAIVSADHIAALVLRNHFHVLFPHIRKEPARAFLIEPFDLFRATEKNAA